MSARWMLFVSARHFRTKRREKGHTAGILSTLGIAAGVMTLIAVLAVMNGFQFGTIEDILEVGSYHLQVETSETDAAAAVIGAVPGVAAALPYAETYGMAYGYFPDPLAVMVRAVPADLLDRDAGFARNVEIVSGRWDLSGSSIVIGQELARRLGLRVGDAVELIGFANGAALSADSTTSLELVGIFKSGLLEYDTGWAFVGLDGGGAALGISHAQKIGVKLVDRYRDNAVRTRVSAALSKAGIADATIESWRDYNRAIFGALRLEKTLMKLLIGLIFVVVGVNIYQSLRRSVVERTEEIGVLKAIGAPPLPLRLVFVFEGLWIGLVGAAVGLALGLLISLNINAVFAIAEAVVNGIASIGAWIVSIVSGAPDTGGGGFTIFSPAYFYLERVPAVVVPSEVVGIVVFAVLSSTVAAYVASARVSGIAPAEVLRYE